MLEVSDLQVHYQTDRGPVEAVKSISLAAGEGEFCTFLGPSGCGKTTTLRCIAGLETPTRGRISIAGQPVYDSQSRVDTPTHKRDLGMVFQSYAIWPHMSVYGNVAFPLEAAGVPRQQARAEVARALDMVGLGSFAERSATQLSGGQQQRVALARAIVRGGKVLLLDEPLSNLDAKLREQMRDELRELQRRLKTTTVFVTHDQDEALAMSDRIVVMNQGAIVEQGTPIDLYQRPQRVFTARFIGKAEVFSCEALQEQGGQVTVNSAVGTIVAAQNTHLGMSARNVMIRPEAIEIVGSGAGKANCFEAEVVRCVFVGARIEYQLRMAADRHVSVSTASGGIQPVGAKVTLHFPPERCVLLPAD
ncbi:ABC transporter ATP-binding protein [Bordetella petrii]|uniref:ABC transporter ATP-binding protein n=1 Tax=Bordetella petrii TaxID=94624 RepID=UPI001E3AD697|nr:ABC transporter ATP-binding protein [Bordetella petrii]MCD0503420.1 ABC transporter ATP-binding protein [Bordetella petrii]